MLTHWSRVTLMSSRTVTQVLDLENVHVIVVSKDEVIPQHLV